MCKLGQLMEYGQRQTSAVLRLRKKRPPPPPLQPGCSATQAVPNVVLYSHFAQPDPSSRAPATLSSDSRRHSAVGEVAYVLTNRYVHKQHQRLHKTADPVHAIQHTVAEEVASGEWSASRSGCLISGIKTVPVGKEAGSA